MNGMSSFRSMSLSMNGRSTFSAPLSSLTTFYPFHLRKMCALYCSYVYQHTEINDAWHASESCRLLCICCRRNTLLSRLGCVIATLWNVHDERRPGEGFADREVSGRRGRARPISRVMQLITSTLGPTIEEAVQAAQDRTRRTEVVWLATAAWPDRVIRPKRRTLSLHTFKQTTFNKLPPGISTTPCFLSQIFCTFFAIYNVQDVCDTALRSYRCVPISIYLICVRQFADSTPLENI